MGCDIHCYVEFRPRKPKNDYQTSWRDFGGRINPGRHYGIFERMAGVRGDGDNAVVPPRGYPEDAGWSAREDNWLRIAYGKTQAQCVEDEVDEATAKRYARYREPGAAYLGDNNGKPRYVAHPDWHTHSWLTTDEFAEALAGATHASPEDEPKYHAMVAAMRSLEASGQEARVVFWFDN